MLSRFAELMGMGVFHPYVVVVGDYAVAEWYGAGGGETFFKRSGKRWTRFTGGGAYSAQGLIFWRDAASCGVQGDRDHRQTARMRGFALTLETSNQIPHVSRM